MAEGFAIHINK
ncbi:hypothetical protein D046_1864A, partial [Vibrio parahaemolyticus V-223/04]